MTGSHSTTLDIDHGVSVQLVCSCGWSDAPWLIEGLENGYLELVADHLGQATIDHLTGVPTGPPR